MKRLLRRVAFLLVVWLLLYAGTGIWASGHLLQPERRKLQDYHKEILDQPAARGLRLVSYTGPAATPVILATPSTLPPRDPCKALMVRDLLTQRRVTPPIWGQTRGTVVLLHGYHGRKEDFLPVAERFCAVGFRCLLIDLPGHGDHPQPYATFGHSEVALVETLLRDAETRFHCAGEPAFLFGMSQGGAIALQTAAHTPTRWSGVVSVASFASLAQPIRCAAQTVVPQAKWSVPLLASACCSGVELRAGFDPAAIRPIDAAKKLSLPVMIVHGDADTFIPVQAGRDLFAALPEGHKTLRIIPGGTHATVLATGSTALYAEICGFFLKVRGPTHQPEPAIAGEAGRSARSAP